MRVLLTVAILLSATATHAACEPPAGSVVLMIDGVKGDSVVNVSCKETIDISSARLNLQSGGATFSKRIDIASRGLFEGSAAGRHFAAATLFVGGTPVRSFEFKDVTITVFRQTANPASETIELTAGAIRPATRPAAGDNKDSRPGAQTPEPKPQPIESFSGSTTSPTVQMTLKLDGAPAPLERLSFDVNHRGSKAAFAMTGTVAAPLNRDPQARAFAKAEITMLKDNLPFLKYELTQVRVIPNGKQLTFSFDTISIEVPAPSSGTTAPGKTMWSLKENKAV